VSARRIRSKQTSLRVIQRAMHAAVIRPLATGNRMQRQWIDGRTMHTVADEFIKPNDRLTSFDRLEIYNRMYWFRIIDSFYDDNPGLRALLGERKFNRLALAYLAQRPSQSFTLRNLCAGLEVFVRRERRWTEPRTKLAIDIARFEWAQTVAFDEASRPIIAPTDFETVSPSRLRLGLQPYVQLLDLNYPVDTYVIAVKERDALRGTASHATGGAKSVRRARSVRAPTPMRTWVAVHRVDNRLYYKRLEAAAFRVLAAIRDGATLTKALAKAGRGVRGETVREWFALWTSLGWLCRRK
jgi:hypothetical protein